MRLIYRIKQLLLGLGDLLALSLGLYLSLLARYWQYPAWPLIERHLAPFFWLFFIWLAILFINGLYDLTTLKKQASRRYFWEAAIWCLLIGIVFFYIFPQQKIFPKTVLFFNIIFGFGLSYGWRLIYNAFINPKGLITKVMFIGLTPESEELIKLLENYPERGYQPVAVADNSPATVADYPFLKVFNVNSNLSQIVQDLKIPLLIIAPHLKQETTVVNELYQLLFSKMQFADLYAFYEIITGRVPPSAFSETWFLEHLKNQEKPIYDKFRILLDKLIGAVMFIFLALLFPFIALSIKLNSRGPIFFKQKRVGKLNKEFTMYKFRSMLALAADGSAETAGFQFAAKNDERITVVGKFLRQTRLDELPQCLNLLKGEVTIIGPRPERPEIIKEMAKEVPYYSLRHIVKPGLTGWAVLHQNYTDNLETTLEKLQYDLFYIKNKSWLLDLSIILRTINIVLRRTGQ